MWNATKIVSNRDPEKNKTTTRTIDRIIDSD